MTQDRLVLVLDEAIGNKKDELYAFSVHVTLRRAASTSGRCRGLLTQSENYNRRSGDDSDAANEKAADPFESAAFVFWW